MPFDGPVTPSEPVGFSHEQMLRCDNCLRANPPTRVSCLYCGAALTHTEASAQLRMPTLRQPDKHEQGYNTILRSSVQGDISVETLQDIAKLLKLRAEDLQKLLEVGIPVPLARAASSDETDLASERLRVYGIDSLTLSDNDLGVDEVVRARALSWNDETLFIYQSTEKEFDEVRWSDLRLLVAGRLQTKKVEVVERMSRGSEKELLDASQYFADEPVFDLHTSTQRSWRIGANSFDFSCLNELKSLIAGENLQTLRRVVQERSPAMIVDERYKDLRTTLEPVWPNEQETQSRGWRRERPGKYSMGAATHISNDPQFTRYSRLQRYLILNSLA
jgi:hypothetical protein